MNKKEQQAINFLIRCVSISWLMILIDKGANRQPGSSFYFYAAAL